MSGRLLPSPKEIRAIFEEELTIIGGRISDDIRHRGRLYLRATVPHTRQVRPNDHIQGGVAITTVDQDIRVYPYVFRQIGRNGAIMTQLLETQRIKRVSTDASSRALGNLKEKLRHTIRLCAGAETLSTVTEQLRHAAEAEVDASIQLSAVISRLPRRQSSLLLSQILSEFHDDEDDSVYALMNAVTVVARDEQDPETRWDLEELAGGVPGLHPRARTAVAGVM
jgi:hypothetical protein